MQTLFNKVNSGMIEPLDALDITLSLCCMIEDCTTFSHLDPRRILLDEDNHVTIGQDEGAVDCFYAAPDVVFEGAAASIGSMRFSTGCLLFYMLNGKSYYDAYNLDLFETLEAASGKSLVDPNVYAGRASDIICALTAWNPEERAEGMGKLLQAVTTAPAVATLQYVCNGQTVLTEQINLKETLHDYRSSQTVTGEDGKAYTILPGATVAFRPGTHPVKIPVALASGAAAGTGPVAPPPVHENNLWLAVAFNDPNPPHRSILMRVMPLDGAAHVKTIPVSLVQKARYTFGSMKLDENGRSLGGKELFHVDIPQDDAHKRAYLHISYHTSPKGFSVILVDENGKKLSNPLHFKMS